MISYETITLNNRTTLAYAVVLPPNFTPDQTYPVLLALPPGPQTLEMVEVGLQSYWTSEALKRGWVVLSPAAPEAQLFFQGSEIFMPEFLTQTAARYRPEKGKYYLGGVSNGGISAFRIAINNPELFQGLLALPGFPRTEEDFQRLKRLIDIPVTMFIGEHDTGWLPRMQATRDELARLSGHVSLEIVPDEGHFIRSLAGGERLFDQLESFRSVR